MGSTLTVTSNPTRTSPVKRGKWILENVLGTPPPPPAPDVPELPPTAELKGTLERVLSLLMHPAPPAQVLQMGDGNGAKAAKQKAAD